MAKSVNPLVLDAALDYLSSNGTRYDICSDEPTTYAEATSTYSLGTTSLSSGDYSKSNGDVSGRKLTVAEKTDIEITATDDATHLAITNGSDTLLYVTVLSGTIPVEIGRFADIAAWNIELRDPL